MNTGEASRMSTASTPSEQIGKSEFSSRRDFLKGLLLSLSALWLGRRGELSTQSSDWKINSQPKIAGTGAKDITFPTPEATAAHESEITSEVQQLLLECGREISELIVATLPASTIGIDNRLAGQQWPGDMETLLLNPEAAAREPQYRGFSLLYTSQGENWSHQVKSLEDETIASPQSQPVAEKVIALFEGLRILRGSQPLSETPINDIRAAVGVASSYSSLSQEISVDALRLVVRVANNSGDRQEDTVPERGFDLQLRLGESPRVILREINPGVPSVGSLGTSVSDTLYTHMAEFRGPQLIVYSHQAPSSDRISTRTGAWNKESLIKLLKLSTFTSGNQRLKIGTEFAARQEHYDLSALHQREIGVPE